MGAGKDKTFGEYLQAIGLADRPISKEITNEQAFAKADAILEKIRKMKGDKSGK